MRLVEKAFHTSDTQKVTGLKILMSRSGLYTHLAKLFSYVWYNASFCHLARVDMLCRCHRSYGTVVKFNPVDFTIFFYPYEILSWFILHIKF